MGIPPPALEIKAYYELFKPNKLNLGRCGSLVRGLRIEHPFAGKSALQTVGSNFFWVRHFASENWLDCG